jgi:two-component system chemotaxis sensor kinase CheA
VVDRAKLLLRLMATFLDELDEHVRTLNRGVLALEKDSSSGDRGAVLAELFRAAHSLKGAARAVAQPAIEQVCHHIESVLGGLRDQRLAATPQLFTLLLSTADAISSAGQCLRADEAVDDKSLGEWESRLKAMAVGDEVDLPDTERVPVPREDGASTQAASAPAPVKPVEIPKRSTPPAPADQRPIPSIPSATSEVELETVSRDESVDTGPPAMLEHSIASTVRVSQEKLDQLLACTDELLVARQRVESHPVAVESLLDSVTEWKQEWQGVQRTLVRMIEDSGADPLLARSSQYAARLIQTVEGTGERLRDMERTLERLRRQTLSDVRQLNNAGATVQDHVHQIRMVPFEEACAGLERAVRDIATSTGKTVDLHVEGGDIELDRSVVTGLADPLLHLVRNAVDHGIESPTERQAVGKSETGRVIVSAELRGSQVQVVVADDGQGLSLDRIRQRLVQQGLPEPSDTRDLVNSIFLPGFSTVEIVTDVSGRGVGMDVVKSQVERLRGSIDITSQPGLGTRFTLRVPLTLTTISGVFVEIENQPFVLPSSNVRKLVRFDPDELRSVQGQDTLSLGGSPVPVVPLNELLNRRGDVKTSETGRMLGVVAQSGVREAVLVVDGVSNEQEIVVKNLGPRIHRLPHVSGGTLLRSGEIALLLNVSSLMRTLVAGHHVSRGVTLSVAAPVNTMQRVLVVDDSMTTRTLIRSILEAAGYDVTTAVDGQDAWDRLQAMQPPANVVVADVEMPRMDGFQLTETLRSSEQFSRTPIVLVTSRDNQEDIAEGVRVGASAYLVKSQFDQTNILETIQQLL